MSKPKHFILPALVLLIAVAALYHYRLSPEARVKRAVVDGIKACENADLESVMAFFHPDFADSLGFDSEAWRALLAWSFAYYKNVDVKLIQPVIAVTGETATFTSHVRVDATVATSMGTTGAPMRPTAYRQDVVLALSLHDGDWKLTNIGDVSAAEWGVPIQKVLSDQ
jgi:ketosteroid isomerase-like protein